MHNKLVIEFNKYLFSSFLTEEKVANMAKKKGHSRAFFRNTSLKNKLIVNYLSFPSSEIYSCICISLY